MKRFFYYISGWLAIILGVIGILLPLLPTTPFMLLAAFCFARSSDRCHRWLLNHRIFGPLITDWQRYGVIRTSTKRLATISMLLIGSIPLYLLAWPLKLLVASIFICVLTFIWTRPASPLSTKVAECPVVKKSTL